ncbi:MAG: hypothetical protein Q4D62_11435 [Planctomycetia bacterium]|nr:hypothetical protein [Planctomycetia bacterium]
MRILLEEERKMCEPGRLWRNYLYRNNPNCQREFLTYQSFLECIINEFRNIPAFIYSQKHPEKEVEKINKPLFLEYELISKELEYLKKYGWDSFYQNMWNYYHSKFDEELMADPDSLWATEYRQRMEFLESFRHV